MTTTQGWEYSWNSLHPVVNHANLLACDAGLQIGPRKIFEHQMIYVVSGKGTVKIGANTYIAKSGDLYYYGPHIPHEFHADQHDPFTVYGLHFSLDAPLPEHYLLKPVRVDPLATYPTHIPKNRLTIRGRSKQLVVPEYKQDCQWAEDILADITHHFERNEETSFQYNRAQLLLFFIRLHEHLMQIPMETKQDRILKRIRDKLRSHAEFPYDRTWLKTWSHYHEDHAARLFTQTYGISPHQYHMQEKLLKAKRYLISTDLSISHITEKLQFGTIHYFSRTFKQHTGMSPSAYRKQYRTL